MENSNKINFRDIANYNQRKFHEIVFYFDLFHDIYPYKIPKTIESMSQTQHEIQIDDIINSEVPGGSIFSTLLKIGKYIDKIKDRLLKKPLRNYALLKIVDVFIKEEKMWIHSLPAHREIYFNVVNYSYSEFLKDVEKSTFLKIIDKLDNFKEGLGIKDQANEYTAFAIIRGNLELIGALIEKGMRLNTYLGYLQSKDILIVVDNDDDTPLKVAIKSKNPNTVKFLLDHGVKKDKGEIEYAMNQFEKWKNPKLSNATRKSNEITIKKMKEYLDIK